MAHSPCLSPARISRLAVAAGAVAVASLGSAADASAATYCVSDVACVKSGGKVEASLTTAINDAQGTAASDVIQLGAGTYEGNWNTGVPSSPLQIVGAGQGKTVLTAKASGPGFGYPWVLTLQSSAGNPASVRDLSITLAGKSPRGLDLLGGSAATRVDVSSIGAVDGTGVQGEPGTFDGGTITMPGLDNTAVSLESGASILRNATISAEIGVDADAPTNDSLVQRTRITSPTAVGLNSGVLHLEDSLIDGRNQASGDLIRVYSSNAGAPPAHLFMANDTVVGEPTSPMQVGLDVTTANAGDNRLATVTNTIFTGAPTSVSRIASAGTANVTLDHSVHGPVTTLNQGGGGQGNGAGTFVETAPLGNPATLGFVDAAGGNFRLAVGSPLIDAGAPGPLGADESLLDLDNAPRLTDGNQDGKAVRDVGAYERQAPAVLGDAPQGPADPGTGDTTTVSTPDAGGSGGNGGGNTSTGAGAGQPQSDRVAPRMTKLKISRGTGSRAAKRRSTLAFTLDEAASITGTLTHRVGKRWVAVKGSIALIGKGGSNTLVLPTKVGGKTIKAGPYRLVVVARDAAGNATAPVTLSLTVR